MNLNVKKCSVMHFGNTNSHQNYLISSDDNSTFSLKETAIEKDLGIFISNELKWDKHIAECTKKANRMLGMIKRTFKNRNLEGIKRLYTSLVRPILDYGAPVWSPFLRKDIERVENIQRRATKLINSIRNLDYPTRLKRTNLSTLEVRRVRGDMIQLFKAAKGFERINWLNDPFQKTNTSKRRHPLQISREIVKNSNIRHNFLPNRASSTWNSLPLNCTHSSTLNQFKNRLDKLCLNSYYNVD